MAEVTKADEALTEYVIEEGWQLSRRFMREIEHELNCEGQLPVNILLASQNLAVKWIEFGRNN